MLQFPRPVGKSAKEKVVDEGEACRLGVDNLELRVVIPYVSVHKPVVVVLSRHKYGHCGDEVGAVTEEVETHTGHGSASEDETDKRVHVLGLRQTFGSTSIIEWLDVGEIGDSKERNRTITIMRHIQHSMMDLNMRASYKSPYVCINGFAVTIPFQANLFSSEAVRGLSTPSPKRVSCRPRIGEGSLLLLSVPLAMSGLSSTG